MAMRTASVRDVKTKPQGSAASWGMVKGVMEMSPMEKPEPEWKYSTAGSQAGSALGAGASSSSGSAAGSAAAAAISVLPTHDDEAVMDGAPGFVALLSHVSE